MALFDTTFAPYVPFGSRTLSVGAAGTDVAILQAVYDLMLKAMSPPQGPMGSPITIDGVFGAETGQAVLNIQSYFGIAATGVADDDAYFLFGQGVDVHTPYGGPVYGSRQLTEGTTGGDVTVLQNRLNCFRYSVIIGSPADGTFGPTTAQAVLAFKVAAATNGDTGFPNNSIAGFGFYDGTWLYTFAGGRDISADTNGFDVVFVQVLLQKLGFYSGRITGYDDAATMAAVTAFQTAVGLTANGIVEAPTFYHFGLRNLVDAPSPLGLAWPAPTPTPPPPVGCLNGIDDNANLAPLAACLKSQGFAFVLRYLGGPCYRAVPLTTAEARALAAAGLLIGSIYVGANTVAAFSCGTQSLAQGGVDAVQAVTLAQAVGQPTASAIYLDLQGGSNQPDVPLARLRTRLVRRGGGRRIPTRGLFVARAAQRDPQPALGRQRAALLGGALALGGRGDTGALPIHGADVCAPLAVLPGDAAMRVSERGHR